MAKGKRQAPSAISVLFHTKGSANMRNMPQRLALAWRSAVAMNPHSHGFPRNDPWALGRLFASLAGRSLPKAKPVAYGES